MEIAQIADVTLRTLAVGAVATVLCLVPGILLGWLLARERLPGRALLQTVVCLPMVLPPVAVGLLLLHLLARGSFVGDLAARVLGGPVLLTWWAAVAAAAVMSFPLLVLGAQQGFAAVPRRLEQVAATLGASPVRVFCRVSLPLAARSIVHGALFAFARALGEFGATTLVAGHIPGQTETLALAIYARIEQFDDKAAWLLALVSVGLALLITLAAELCLRRVRR
jgi:molybdate transport system permease protein